MEFWMIILEYAGAALFIGVFAFVLIEILELFWRNYGNH